MLKAGQWRRCGFAAHTEEMTGGSGQELAAILQWPCLKDDASARRAEQRDHELCILVDQEPDPPRTWRKPVTGPEWMRNNSDIREYRPQLQ